MSDEASRSFTATSRRSQRCRAGRRFLWRRSSAKRNEAGVTRCLIAARLSSVPHAPVPALLAIQFPDCSALHRSKSTAFGVSFVYHSTGSIRNTHRPPPPNGHAPFGAGPGWVGPVPTARFPEWRRLGDHDPGPILRGQPVSCRSGGGWPKEIVPFDLDSGDARTAACD